MNADRIFARLREHFKEYFAEALLPSCPDERHFHTDLPDLDAAQLRSERERLRVSALLADRPSPWIPERIAHIDTELERRIAHIDTELERRAQ